MVVMVFLGGVDDSSPSFVFNTPLHYHIADVVIIIEKAKLYNDIDYAMYKVAKGDLQYHHYYHHHHHYYHHYHRYYSLSIIITIIHHHYHFNHRTQSYISSASSAIAASSSLLLTFTLSSGYDHPFSDTIRILSIIQIISCKEEYGKIYSCKEEYWCLIIIIIHSTWYKVISYMMLMTMMMMTMMIIFKSLI